MAPPLKRRKLSNGSFESVAETTSAETVQLEQKPKADQRRSLFVRSLPASVTTERLTEYFSESYPLKHATVVLDPKTKISKGFGFVTFTDAEDAQAAAEQFNDSIIDGRKIKVEVAQSRHRDAEDGEKSGPNRTGIDLRAQREKQKGDAQPPRLIVRNLPWSIKEPQDLAKLFRSYGKVKHAVVPTKGPKTQYGFGIVVIRGKKNAEKAIAGVNGKEVDGRILAVDWAVDKKTWEETQGSNLVPDVQTSDNEPARPGSEDEVDQAAEEPSSDDTFHTAEGGDETSETDEHINSLGVASDGVVSHAETDSDVEDDDSSDEDEAPQKNLQNNTTVFIRNLPFTTDDDGLKTHFQHFGAVRYARVVYDQETERSKGTAFVCFFDEEDAKTCVKGAPKHDSPLSQGGDKKRRGEAMVHSVLQNEATDPTGRYTMDGRVLQVSRALSREDATKRADEASAHRDVRDRDKRRLYLLSEGTISKSSKLYDVVGKAEIDVRESSARQRQKLIKTNPNLCLSLTRLSVRNIPRSIGSKELKALARDAVVGFSTDVKSGLREPLSKEELARGGEAMKEAERKRKQKGVGIVRQAKIVFEGREGGKVKEGGGRSRGYGFIEYVSHRNALAGLRWLNGHMVKVQGGSGDKGKRLIVEFAIENAQVVQRRNEREQHSREAGPDKARNRKETKGSVTGEEKRGKKRKRPSEAKTPEVKPEAKEADDDEGRNRLAKRNRIIMKKRQMRKARKG